MCDNGPELTSKAMFFWAKERRIKLQFIQPGKPTQNPFVAGTLYACHLREPRAIVRYEIQSAQHDRITMRKHLIIVSLALAMNACSREEPEPWNGPVLTPSRDQLTVEQLNRPDTPPLLDMSYFAQPDWAQEAGQPFSGSISFAETEMIFPKDRDPYAGEDLFPRFTVEFIAHNGELILSQQGVIDTRSQSGSFWDVMPGTGKVWREQGDEGWSRSSFPLNLTDRGYLGQVRNCIATFVYNEDAISNVYVQCSQETADIQAQQVGNIRAMVPAAYEPRVLSDAGRIIDQHAKFRSRRTPVYPLSKIDDDGEIADYFNKSLWTNASTSVGAVLMDGKLYVNPPRTRHGAYPYPSEMRHGVYSVTKSMAGALAIFYFAERYGADVFDELITDYVPALADRPGWQGVTFSHALNMATGVRAGEAGELLLHPLVLATTKEDAIDQIAQLGDYPEAPGEKFNYATTNTFVLSYALQNYVEEREGANVRYWDFVHEDVLTPIGAEDFRVLYTRDKEESVRIPFLGYGALPTLDNAAKIALLISNEGVHEGRQLLNREKIREAFGRTEWAGYQVGNWPLRYRHSFWSKGVRTGNCNVDVVFMEGHGSNHVLFLPSGAIVFRFMDEFDKDFDALVRGVERIRSSCQ